MIVSDAPNSPDLSIIDNLLPRYDARERHATVVAAPMDIVYQTLRTVNFAESVWLRLLLLLRALPYALMRRPRRGQRAFHAELTLDALLDGGVAIIAESPPTSIMLGLAGPFWQPLCELRPVAAADFASAPPSGSALAAWSFTITPRDGGRVLLKTETRVLVGDASSRRKFAVYWLVVRPFSGLLRRIMLRTVRAAAERPNAAL